MLTVDPVARAALQPYLQPGEELLWAERPRQGILFRNHDLLLVPISVALVGFNFYQLSLDFILEPDWSPGFAWANVLSSSLGVAMLIVMACVMVFLLHLLVGRFIYDAMVRRNSAYGITSSRVIVRSGLFRPTTMSLPHATLTETRLIRHWGGWGTIRLGWRKAGLSLYGLKEFMTGTGRGGPVFDHIAPADEVLALLHEQRSASLSCQPENVAPPQPVAERSPHDEENERLLWSGRPRYRPEFRYYDPVVIFFGLGWIATIVLINAISGSWSVLNVLQAVQHPANFLVWLVQLLFLAIGFYLAAGRYLYDYWNCRKTQYDITDQRVLIRSGVFGQTIWNFVYENIWDVDLIEHGDGTGTIRFKVAMGKNASNFRRSTEFILPDTIRHPHWFRRVSDPKNAFAILQSAMDRARAD